MREVQSTVKRWPGSVLIYDPIPLAAVVAWEDALDKAQALAGEDGLTIAAAAGSAKISNALAPGICACVQEWRLEGLGQVTPETFPGAPRRAAMQLVAMLVAAIDAVCSEEDAIPNA